MLSHWLLMEYTYPQGIYCCLILDSDLKFSRFPSVKKERRVNAFHYVC